MNTGLISYSIGIAVGFIIHPYIIGIYTDIKKYKLKRKGANGER